MSNTVSHLRYFPFCVGYEPEFEYPFFGGGVDGYTSVLRMKLKDAVALYWKPKKARLYFNLSYSGFLETVDPELPPIGRVPQVFTLSIDEELDFYTTDTLKNEKMKNRVCFNEDSNEPFLSFSSPVGGGGILNFYISFFTNTYFGQPSPITNRVFLDIEKPDPFFPNATTDWWPPVFPNNEVFVNVFFVVTHFGSPAYSQYYAVQGPHTIPEISGTTPPNFLLPRRHGFLKIKINNTIYDVETLVYGGPIESLEGTIYNLDIITE